MNPSSLLVLALSCSLTSPAGAAGDGYFVGPLTGLALDQAELPAPDPSTAWRRLGLWSAQQPYAVLAQEAGEVWIAYVTPDDMARPSGSRFAPHEAVIAVRSAVGAPARGTLFFPGPNGRDWLQLDFTIPAGELTAEDGDRSDFFRAKAAAHAFQLERGVAGAAWFRHQMHAAIAARGLEPDSAEPGFRQPGVIRRPRANDVEDTYDLFTGGRALAENLQLDRVIESRLGAERTVAIDTINGITTRELDWTGRIAGLEPTLDPLASIVPADQHGIFFPSFQEMLRVIDEASAGGTPVLQLLEPRAEDARTLARYERQLCLPLTRAARELGPRFVQAVAMTGSDPYLRTGSDVAVLLSSQDLLPLTAFVTAQQAAAMTSVPGAESRSGTVAGLSYAAVVSPDRRVSSYMARVGDTLVVTNSLVQLERIALAAARELPALQGAPEYVFFRERYPLGAGDESAFLVLTDATIRRWCSPRWRIGASRRTLAAALIADAEAELLAASLEGREPVVADAAGIGLALNRGAAGARSTEYGTLDFLTPVAELDLSRVSPQEKQSYETFRTRYQSNWRQWFDPIAVRLHVRDDVLDADLSVMPLIAGSDYNRLIAIGEGVALDPLAGDPHVGAIAHWAMALNTKSNLFGSWTGLASSMAPQLGVEPLSWVGDSVALYAEDDPFWQEWNEALGEDEQELFIEDEIYRLPVVLHVPVKDPLRLAAFLTTLRAFANEAAPGLTVWETRQHGEQGYVRIAPSPSSGIDLQELALYYAALPDALIVTLREDLLLRALDRRGAAPAEPRPEWLGQSYGLRVDQRFIALVTELTRERQLERMQALSWSNLTALNAWRRDLGATDALAFHERTWGITLRCPGNGEYRWNDAWQTYESTVYGHPAEPRAGPSLPPAVATVLSAELGLTFEDDGLRSRARITRGTR